MSLLAYNPCRQDRIAGLFFLGSSDEGKVPSLLNLNPGAILADVQERFIAKGFCFVKGFPLPAPAVGAKFSEWEVLSLPIPGNKATKISRRIRCRCSCGSEAVVGLSDLLSGDSTRCRVCKARDPRQGRAIIHGALRDGKATPEYRSWLGMVVRCGAGIGHRYYASYAAKGVTVYPEWLGAGGFQRFLGYMGLRPSISCYLARYPNPEGNYEPGNVRWATRGEPSRSSKAYKQLLRRATPAWLTGEHWKAIDEIYLNRPLGYHIDHEVPIRGKTVCGLHVPWNLRAIPALDNIKKGNKLVAVSKAYERIPLQSHSVQGVL